MFGLLKSDDLLRLTRRELCSLHITDIVPGSVTPEVMKHWLRVTDGLWQHSGDPTAPHVELTSGLCSDGFVNMMQLLHWSDLCLIAAHELVGRMSPQLRDWVDWVVGSDHAGAAISHAVAMVLGRRHEFTEKTADGGQVWRRFAVTQDEIVLQVEDIVTTSKTVRQVRQAIQASTSEKIHFAPRILTVVHRSSEMAVDGDRFEYLLHLDIQTWKPEECPLCTAGSKRLRPKGQWRQLVASGQH